MDQQLDSLEEALANRLFDWRSRDVRYSSTPDSALKNEDGDRKRRKRKRVQLAETLSAVDAPAVVPRPKPLPKQVEAALSRTLIKPLCGSEWSDLAQATRTQKDLGIVKKRSKAVGGFRRTKSRGNGRSQGRDPGNVDNVVNAAKFVEQHRFEVGALGSSALNKREKKAYQSSQLLRLGCKPPRNQKMPIEILIGMRKKQKERELKEKEKKLEEGVLISSKRRKR